MEISLQGYRENVATFEADEAVKADAAGRLRLVTDVDATAKVAGMIL